MSVQVIILSDSKNERLRMMTEKCIDSLLFSEPLRYFNICVVDNKNRFSKVTNIKIDEPFNYNRYINIAAKQSNSEWIVFCNNDLHFHKNWFTELMKLNLDVMSSRCPIDKRQKIGKDVFGYKIGYNFSGWCFTMKRKVFEKIGGFNEAYEFWCADNAVLDQLKKIDVVPCLVAKSLVTHYGSQTLSTMQNKKELTVDLLKKYRNDNLYSSNNK